MSKGGHWFDSDYAMDEDERDGEYELKKEREMEESEDD